MSYLETQVQRVMDALNDELLITLQPDRAELMRAVLDRIEQRLPLPDSARVTDPDPTGAEPDKLRTLRFMDGMLRDDHGLAALFVLRLSRQGHVRVTGGSRFIHDSAVQEVASVIRKAVYDLAAANMPNGECNCPACQARRGSAFGGPKAEA